MTSKLLRRTISYTVMLAIGLTALLAGVAFLQYRMIALPLSNRSLDAAQSTQAYLLEQQEHSLEQISKTLATTTSFASYIAQALGSAEASGKAIDTVSIRDLLEDRRSELDIDAAAIIDRTKHVIAIAGEGISNGQDLSKDSLLLRMTSSATQASGFLLDQKQLLWVVLTPIQLQADMDSTLMTAKRIDSAFLKSIAGISHSDIALVAASGSGPVLSLSSLQEHTALALQTAIAAQPERLLDSHDGNDAERTVQLELDNERWTARLKALRGSVGKLFLFSLISPKANDDLTRALVVPQAAGLLALLLVLVIVIAVLWKRLLSPLTSLTVLAERVLAGDYDMEYRRSETGTVGKLGLLFNYLLNDLRRHRPPPGGPRRRITDRK